MLRMFFVFLVVLALLALFVFYKSGKKFVLFPDNEQTYRDSISALKAQIDSSKVRQEKLQKAYDSLSSVDPLIIYHTREKIKFILTDAGPNELDSIIRSAWKTKSRYH